MTTTSFKRFAFGLATLVNLSLAHAGIDHTPSAEQRARGESGYIRVPDFYLEIVKENEGTPNSDLVSVIEETAIRDRIENRYYTSLQLKNLDLKFKELAREESSKMRVPFTLSLKHAHGSNENPLNCNRGTVEVSGMMNINEDASGVQVQVDRVDDSQTGERALRAYANCSGSIDLNFARAVVAPELENVFNSNPDRIRSVTDLLNSVAK